MRRLHVKVKNPFAEIASLLFLAQCFDELLFDYTDDSYKAPALNTYSRIIEFTNHCAVADKAGLGQAALTPYLEELQWSVKTDPVLDAATKSLAEIQIALISNQLGQPARLIPLANSLQAIAERYFELTKKRLLALVLNSPNEKKAIRALAEAFCTQIEMEGFSRRYAHRMVGQYLLKRLISEQMLNPQSVIERFFACFDEPEGTWNVYLFGDARFAQFSSYGGPYNLTVQEKEPTFQWAGKLTAEFVSKKNTENTFLILSDISARDPVSARESADWNLNGFISCIRFLRHDQAFNVEKEALVESKKSGVCTPINKGLDPMLSGLAKTLNLPDKELEELNEVVQGHHMGEVATRRYWNALTYHKAALEASVPENQLIDLWAALEGLLPIPGDEPSRIAFFVANLLAPLTLTYPEKLFRRIEQEFSEEGVSIQSIVNVATGKSYFEKVVNIIVAKELEAERVALAAKLDHNPLLRFRAFELWEQFRSRNAIRDTLKAHRSKIGWHVHRIYSTRNAIVHRAEALAYLPGLVEHLHSYLDTLMKAIARVAIGGRFSFEIEGILSLLLAHESGRFKELGQLPQGVDEECTLMTAKDLVFGAANVLKPDY